MDDGQQLASASRDLGRAAPQRPKVLDRVKRVQRQGQILPVAQPLHHSISSDGFCAAPTGIRQASARRASCAPAAGPSYAAPKPSRRGEVDAARATREGRVSPSRAARTQHPKTSSGAVPLVPTLRQGRRRELQRQRKQHLTFASIRNGSEGRSGRNSHGTCPPINTRVDSPTDFSNHKRTRHRQRLRLRPRQ